MRVSELLRPSPERLLLQAQAEETKQWGARLKIFLGYAPGVGKSYRMLDEARRRHERGEDAVVGAVRGAGPKKFKRFLASWSQFRRWKQRVAKPWTWRLFCVALRKCASSIP